MFRALKIQFFLTYAVMGSIVPLLAAILKEEKHFTESQIGLVFSLLSMAIFLSPALVAFLADTRIDPRKIITVALLISAAMLTGVGLASALELVIAFVFIHALVYTPLTSLHDGFYFSASGEKGRSSGTAGGDEEKSNYNRVRIWGSIGFIAPAFPLFYFVGKFNDSTWCCYVAAAFGLLGALHAFRLPMVKLGDRTNASVEGKKKNPTLDAFNVLRSRHVLWLCIAMAFAYIAGNAYYALFPLYLREQVGMDSEFIPFVTGFGVVLELFFIAALEPLRRRFGFRKLILFGIACMVVRLNIIALFPTVATAILVQLLHGPEILALFILPVMFLNREAGDGFRNSIQGLWVMLVVGAPRIVSSYISGMIAEESIILLYQISAGVAFLALVILFLGFKPERRRDPPSGRRWVHRHRSIGKNPPLQVPKMQGVSRLKMEIAFRRIPHHE